MTLPTSDLVRIAKKLQGGFPSCEREGCDSETAQIIIGGKVYCGECALKITKEYQLIQKKLTEQAIANVFEDGKN